MSEAATSDGGGGSGRQVLRSNQWDGPAPTAGDVLDDGTRAWVIRRVSHGAGPGHYTLTVEPVRLYRFRYHDENQP